MNYTALYYNANNILEISKTFLTIFYICTYQQTYNGSYFKHCDLDRTIPIVIFFYFFFILARIFVSTRRYRYLHGHFLCFLRFYGLSRQRVRNRIDVRLSWEKKENCHALFDKDYSILFFALQNHEHFPVLKKNFYLGPSLHITYGKYANKRSDGTGK
jgi:hypothetical protein